MVDPEQASGARRPAGRGARPPARAASAATAWPISSSRSIRRATTIRRRSPKTSCSASRPRAALIGRATSPSTARSARRSRREGLADELVAMGAQHRRDDDRNLPRPAARPSAVRAVLVHRRGRTARVRGHPPPAGAPQRASGCGAATDAVPGPAARLYRAAPSPRASRRGARGAARRRRAAPCARGSSASPIPASSSTTPSRSAPRRPCKDNLLFGRVNHSVANAQARVAEAIAAVVDELGLREEVERVGLDHQVGPAGRLLDRAAAGERQSRALPREAAGHPGGRRRARALRRDARRQRADAPDRGHGRTQPVHRCCRTSARSNGFDAADAVPGGQGDPRGDGRRVAKAQPPKSPHPPKRKPDRRAARQERCRRGRMTLETEVQSLRQVPMFRDIDPARLKLLAFTSERVQVRRRAEVLLAGRRRRRRLRRSCEGRPT